MARPSILLKVGQDFGPSEAVNQVSVALPQTLVKSGSTVFQNCENLLGAVGFRLELRSQGHFAAEEGQVEVVMQLF